MIKRFSFSLFLLLLSQSIWSQVGKQGRYPNYFGFQVRTLFPTKFIGEPTTDINIQNFYSKISQKMGYSFGGTVRAGVTELIAIETGINYTQRYFDIQMSVPDSNVYGSNQLRFTNYDIPINALIYIKFSKAIYMNASFGLALVYKPSSVGVITHPDGKNEFFHYGLVDIHKKVGFDLNANLGFEYRTKSAGIFYLGGSARLPLAPLFLMITKYKYETYGIITSGNINGSYLSLDLKYFLPFHNGSGSIFRKSIIE